MIDIHCHILPDVDDGSDSVQTSLLMAAMSADDKITTVVSTPHITWNNNFSLSKYKRLDEAYDILSIILSENGIPLKLIKGYEVLVSGMDKVQQIKNDFPKIFGTNYSLVEFFFDETEENMNNYLELLFQNNIKPIIAHPERYIAIQKNNGIIKKWKNKGYVIQVNKGSFIGQFGKKSKSTAEWMMNNKLVDVLASDAHDIHYRTTCFSSVIKVLEEKYHKDYIKVITLINPQNIINNASIVNFESHEEPKRDFKSWFKKR